MTEKQKRKLQKVKEVLEDIYGLGKLPHMNPCFTSADALALLSEYQSIRKAADHTTKTISTNTAKVFRRAGFKVIDPDDTKIYYDIILED